MANIAVACFFPAFRPASSGGELRLGKLYEALAKHHTITLLTSTDFGARFEEITHAPNFKEVRFPKDELWRNAYSTLERSEVSGELSGLAFALAVSAPTCQLRVVARELALKSDFFIHDFPFSEPIFSDGCPCREIYNSHNFEASLLSSIVRGEGFDKAFLKLIRMEGNLVRRAYRVFATSIADAEKFQLFYGSTAAKLAVCPNGFDPADLDTVIECRGGRLKTAAVPKLLFTGSAHYPNVEAANFLLSIAADLPDCELVLAGGLSSHLDPKELMGNVKIIGPYDNNAKRELLATADLFLNPVIFGSGTSLKALEALGAGIPMVTTEEGIRGIGVKSTMHCSVVTRDSFVSEIKHVLGNYEAACNIAEAGKRFAASNFPWYKITGDLDYFLEAPIPESGPANPLVLAFNDYSVMQAGSGGISRVRNVLSNIGCDVILLTFGESLEIRFIHPNLLHVTVPKTSPHREFECALASGERMSVNDAAASLFVNSNRILGDLAASFLGRSQAVVFEHPYMAPLLDIVQSMRPDIPIVYSAHNVESRHKASILLQHSIGNKLSQFITDLELHLVRKAQLIIACTEADAAHFRELNSNTIVVPNGCTPVAPALVNSTRKSGTRAERRVGFLGSSHGPNVDAAEFIVEQLAPDFPQVTFEMIGSVCSALPSSLPANIRKHGTVSEEEKSRIMLEWDVALNPISSGGGSSLKLPDYLAHALPTISTEAGARSFNVVEHQAGRITHRGTFGLQLEEMLDQPNILTLEGKRAYEYAARELSWSAVTAVYRREITKMVAEVSSKLPTAKLLVVTYRYNEPPLGGAEEYLIEILKRLRRSFERIDLATVDIDNLTNHHHFGCRYSKLQGGPTLRVGELFDRMRFLPALELPELEILSFARDIERGWSREENRLFSGFARLFLQRDELRVFGGFFLPENHEGITRRWTSPEFSFLLPRAARVFQMKGYASQRKSLKVSLGEIDKDEQLLNRASYELKIDPYFNLNLSLPVQSDVNPMILVLEVDEHQAPGDHRPFGVLLEWAAALQDDSGNLAADSNVVKSMKMSVADLSELHEEEVRNRFFERWLTALKTNLNSRENQLETAFASVRGPSSPALSEWVKKNVASYDVVLVQGIPFDTVPRTVELLDRLPSRPRVVTLPHFHGDDRFYYWRRYLDAFEKSDSNLIFSQSIADALGGSNYAVVPGGGIRPEEHADTNAASRFSELYRDDKPFFLVLGRKTASKGYQQVVRAHQTLKRQNIDCGLVLIGPDEDGLPVVGSNVTYLGRQPRQMVRGALASCRGLVTMSQSESFGIVLCEAWLFGKPVIANRACYSFRELVRNGETGLLVHTDHELVSAMRRLILEPGEAARMGNAGFAVAIESFGWDTVAEACLRELVPSDHSGSAIGARTDRKIYAQ